MSLEDRKVLCSKIENRGFNIFCEILPIAIESKSSKHLLFCITILTLKGALTDDEFNIIQKLYSNIIKESYLSDHVNNEFPTRLAQLIILLDVPFHDRTELQDSISNLLEQNMGDSELLEFYACLQKVTISDDEDDDYEDDADDDDEDDSELVAPFNLLKRIPCKHVLTISDDRPLLKRFRMK